ncbi:MAG: Gfo/Idh/MocA family oxidoreductase [Erysipelotrichaceae bacterium]|nr:Gfo/Idh/MocA family oxidoreductase [Erysipelotrichaceae bacterium]MDY5251524.1 Gfo/Idh/MocA family oxidoreductase [Erysipelotrichaceae bacterium]
MKIGTIGTGSITTVFLENWLKCHQEIGAIYSRQYATGKALADKFNCPKVYTDLDEMLKDEELDIIYVASPNSLHFKQAQKCLLANKHVILEKPFTTTIEECQQLIELSQKNHLFLFEGITTCYLPNLALLKENITKIAPIHMVTCNMSQYSRKYDSYLRGEKPNVFTTKFSGGALMDLNVYNMHLVTSLFGYPKALSYTANIMEGVDFGGSLQFSYDDQLLATLNACKNTHAQSNIMIQGEKGYITCHYAASLLSAFTLHLPNQEPITINAQEPGMTHHYYIAYLLELIKNDDLAGCRARLDHTLAIVKLLVAARKDAHITFEDDQKA